MTLKQYLLGMIAGTLVSWGALSLVINYLNPELAGNMGLAFLYLSLFLSIAGTVTLIGFTWRFFLHKDEMLYRQVSVSFRQGVMIGLAVVIALFLQANKLLTWWNLLLLIIGLTVLEFLALSARRQPPANV